MIPTREQIDAYSKSDFASVKVERWLRDMYAELQFYASACSDRDGYCAQVRKLRDAIIAIGVAVGASVNDSCTTSFLCEVKGEVESVVGNLRADLDRANTEAALARDALAKATTDHRAKVQNELRSVERALCSADVLIKYAEWSRGAYECHVKNTIETAIDALRDDSATTPYSPPFEGDPKDCAFKASDPVREEEIKAWRDWALGDIADPDLYDDCFVLSRAEIDSAVALMRSADGKALLRELRAWIIDEKWCAPGIVRKIDKMLAQPAPVEQPVAAVPEKLICDRKGCGKERPLYAWMSSSKGERKYCCLKCMEDDRSDFIWGEAAPVEKPAAAVPDDTRWELVAQLAEFVAITLKGEVNRDEVQAIANQLRGGA